MKKNGFTYIEFLIYSALVVLVLTFLIPFAWNVIEGGSKSATELDVYATAAFISDKLSYEIRNAEGINTVAPTSISLIASGSANPTIIDVASGAIRIKRGSGTVTTLNSSTTSVSALTFTNLTATNSATKHIQFMFTLQANNNSARQEFNESVIFEGAAEVRGN